MSGYREANLRLDVDRKQPGLCLDDVNSHITQPHLATLQTTAQLSARTTESHRAVHVLSKPSVRSIG